MATVETKVLTHRTHVFHSLEDCGFDSAAYSRMKFGSGRDARNLGREMAEAFAAEFWPMLTSRQGLVIPAPSTSVPVAATLMGWHFHNHLNHLLDSTGNMPVQWDLVHRAVTYNDNYAQLSLQERQKLLADDERHMNVSFAEGKVLIFVDDVRITGTHEEKLLHMLDELGVQNTVIFATYAEYAGDRPGIEHDLNHCYVRDAFDVQVLSQDELWNITTRTLRLILECPTEEFQRLLDGFSRRRREEIYHASIVKGYSRHEPYEQNFHLLRDSVDQPELGL